MKKMIFLFASTLISTASQASSDRLDSKSYVEEGKTCYQLVYDFAKKSLPEAQSADYILPLSHLSITPGTYNQTFISVVNVNEDYYTLVSSGSFDCDDLSLVRFYKIDTN